MNRPHLSGIHPSLPRPRPKKIPGLPGTRWAVSGVRFLPLTLQHCTQFLFSLPIRMSRKWALGDNRSCALSKSQALVTMSDSMESKTQQVVIPGKNGLGLWDLREGGLRGSLWQSLLRLWLVLCFSRGCDFLKPTFCDQGKWISEKVGSTVLIYNLRRTICICSWYASAALYDWIAIHK